MSKWQVLQQNILKRITQAFNSIPPTPSERVSKIRIMPAAGLTLSVIILQAYLGTGVREWSAFASAAFLAIAIPLLALSLFISSIFEDLDEFARRVYGLSAFIGIIRLWVWCCTRLCSFIRSSRNRVSDHLIH